jgi:hypothetical protein
MKEGKEEGIKWANNFEELINNISDTLKQYDGQLIGIDRLFTAEFMSQHTGFADFDAWIAAGGFQCETQEDFDGLPKDELDSYVAQSTDFNSWQEMLDASGAKWLQNQLGW